MRKPVKPLPPGTTRVGMVHECILQGFRHEFVPVKQDKRKAYRTPFIFETTDKNYPAYPKRFWLCYHPGRTGTGPFATRKKAEDWYNNGGR